MCQIHRGCIQHFGGGLVLGIQLARVAQRLIGRLQVAELHEHRAIKGVQLKHIGPTLDRGLEGPARVLKLVQLKIGQREVVLHLRGLRRQLGRPAQRLERGL